MENFVCVLTIHLHNNGILGAEKCKVLKMVFKVQSFENYTDIHFVRMVMPSTCVAHYVFSL